MSQLAADPRYELYEDLLAQLAWRDRAACLGVDEDVFFPRRGESVQNAKAICVTCPVLEDCREFAIERVIRVGVFGGMSERERRRERHQRARERAGLERLPDPDYDPAPAWVDEQYKALWHRRRSPRRATFGAGSAESKRVARHLAQAG